MEEEIEERLSDAAQRVSDHFSQIEQDIPGQSFVVGGYVRDTIMGLDPNDMDFVVVGENRESMEEKGFEPIEASSFPVFHDSEHEEWALVRTEEKTGEGYTGFEVFTDDVSLEDDLERRDLRCNAIALNPMHGDSWVLVDPHDGREDIENGILRHVSDAFSEDPLRILRVARYAARFAQPVHRAIAPSSEWTGKCHVDEPLGQFAFEHIIEADDVHPDHPHQPVEGDRPFPVGYDGFIVADETEQLMRRLAPELNRMSRDRIGMEIEKAMVQARNPARFWRVLEQTGALSVLWPDLDRAKIVPAGPDEHHAEGMTFRHTLMVLNRMWEICWEEGITGHDRARRLLAAVAHDVGKPVVADDTGGIHSDDPPVHFGGHADRGAATITDACRRMGLMGDLASVMFDAARLHMDVHDIDEMDADELIEFVTNRVGLVSDEAERPRQITIDELVDLANADEEGRKRLVPLVEAYPDAADNLDIDGETSEYVEDRVPVRPTFDRREFVDRVEAVRSAVEQADGFAAMREGLCGEHGPVGDGSLKRVLSNCEDCRSPGPWIGETIDEMRAELVREEIEDG